MKLKLSSRLVITMVVIQIIVLTTLIWNNQRVFKKTHAEQQELAYTTEQKHLIETVSLGLLYSDRAMLSEILLHLQERPDFSYAVITDRKDRVMASSGAVPDDFSQIDFNSPYKNAVDLGLYHLSSKVYKNSRFLGTFRIGFSTAQLTQILQSSKLQNISLSIVAVILTLIASILVGRYIVTNLRLLEDGARHFGDGDFDYRIKHVKDNTIDDVASAFNELAENLQVTIDELDERNRLLFDSEEQVRLLLDSTAEAIYGLDMQGNCTFANPACLQLLGYQNDNELIGHNMHSLIHHTRRDGTPYPEDECPINSVLIRGSGVHTDDEPLWRADGSSFPSEYWSYPILRNDKITGAVVTFLDITERRQAEEGLRRSQKMDAIGQLTGGIAHDFNNILSVILGNLELLEHQTEIDDKGQKQMASIKKAGLRAADLTKQLLSFSRSQPDQKISININKVMAEMESLITRSLTPNVAVRNHFADDLWLTEIDPGDFEDVLLNLSINARDAMAGRGNLTIETRNTRLDAAYCRQNSGVSPGEYVELAVSDSGEGIPREVQRHIFEPFYTTKEQGKGTGLGLAMVFGFVKRSGGYIKCYSEVGVGTTFRLYLPRAQGDEQSVEQGDEQIENMPHGHETILVVDDEVDLLELVRELLEGLGYRVLTASDGKQALEQLAEEPAIELLFSDVVMPGGINGYELAELATHNNPELKVLLTSGYTGKSLAYNGQSRFNTNLLSKPYSQSELSRRVRTMLDSQEMH